MVALFVVFLLSLIKTPVHRHAGRRRIRDPARVVRIHRGSRTTASIWASLAAVGEQTWPTAWALRRCPPVAPIHGFPDRTKRGQRPRVRRDVVDDLGRECLVRSGLTVRSRGTFGVPERPGADAVCAAVRTKFRSQWAPTLLGSLSGLARHSFSEVAHALALVGLGFAKLADVGGDLSRLLLCPRP